jgi:hypothetical protein
MNRRALSVLFVGALVWCVLLLCGCAGTRDTQTRSVTVQVREELSAGKVVRLKTTTTTNAAEQEATTSAPDGALIGEQAAAAAIAAIKAVPAAAPIAAGIDWASILAGGGALATTAATGYLAVKKREQMRAPSKAKS